jgi:hypothetical protein
LVEKRVAAGLTVDDIRNYWNQTPLMLEIQTKFLEMADYMALNVAQQLVKTAKNCKPSWLAGERPSLDGVILNNGTQRYQ